MSQSRAALVAVGAVFFVNAVGLGTWVSRIPAVKESLGLSERSLGLALLALGLGALAGMQCIGPLIAKHGSNGVTTGVGVGFCLSLSLIGVVHTYLGLHGALFVLGLFNGCLDVAMNANAIQVERLRGRITLPALHAMWSLGGFAGAALGGVAAEAEVAVSWHFITASAVLLFVTAMSAPWLTHDRKLPQQDVATAPAAVTTQLAWSRGVLLLGLLGFCCMLGEGAAADWAGVYLQESLGTTPGMAAAGYVAFSTAMVAGRLSGGWVTEQLGKNSMLRWSSVVGSVGLGIGLAAGTPTATLVGLFAFGLGASCIVPLIFSAAGNLPDVESGMGIARVTTLGYLGFLVGPVAIGLLADWVGLKSALFVPVVLMAVIAVASNGCQAQRGMVMTPQQTVLPASPIE